MDSKSTSKSFTTTLPDATYPGSLDSNSFIVDATQPPPPYVKSPESESSDEELEQESKYFVPVPPLELTNLSRPIAIPATSPQLGSPFLRAYPPALERFNVSRQQFLAFMDELNRVATVSPPVQLLGLAGDIVGFVPDLTAQIVGPVLSATAMAVTYAMSKGGTEIVLRKANREIFRPRGLQAQVAKLEVVAKLANMPILNESHHIDKSRSIMESLDSLTSNGELHTLSGQQRRLRALEPWIEPLDIENLPPVDSPSNPAAKMHQWVSERNRKTEESRMIRKRTRGYKKLTKESDKVARDYESEVGDLNREEQRLRAKGGENMTEKLQKLGERRQKVDKEHEKTMEAMQKRYIKRDREERSLRRIYFLLLTTATGESDM